MKQARVLSEAELKRVLAVAAAGRHAARNRLALLLSHLAGLRVGEIAALTVGNVLDGQGGVRDQLHLNPAHTKGGFSRTVFLNQRLQREIGRYLRSWPDLTRPEDPLLRSLKGRAFSANSLCQLVAHLYRRAGIDGACSHSGRRGFITKLAHAGISPKVIMELAGHRHLGTTQRYIEVNDAMKRVAVEVL